jgi:mxaC protein
VLPAFDHPWVLLAMPLALLPFLPVAGESRPVAAIAPLPHDPLAAAIAWLLRLLAALALGALVVALAGPYTPERREPRTVTGGEIVIALDRSRSMDQSFVTPGPLTAGGWTAQRESKGEVARRLLAQFAGGRTHDRFALIVFSSRPMRVLDFTDKPDTVQAAIAASNIGRGLSDTDIGAALLAALDQFADRPYSGLRVVLLVSDGGAQLDPDMQRDLARAFRRERAQLYWIYLRSRGSPGLRPQDTDAAATDNAVQEVALDRFFRSMGTPYSVYEAENPAAVSRAIGDIAKLASQPMEIQEALPRRDARMPWIVAATAATVLLVAFALAARAMQGRDA